jgi:hypothetical protein
VRTSLARRTARGEYDTGVIRHSVGEKVAGDASLCKCCNLDTSGGKRRWLSRDSNLLPVADTTYSWTVRSAPHPPNGRARAKAPAVCWGFRLSLLPEILTGARRSAPAGFEMIALNVLG